MTCELYHLITCLFPFHFLLCEMPICIFINFAFSVLLCRNSHLFLHIILSQLSVLQTSLPACIFTFHNVFNEQNPPALPPPPFLFVLIMCTCLLDFLHRPSFLLVTSFRVCYFFNMHAFTFLILLFVLLHSLLYSLLFMSSFLVELQLRLNTPPCLLCEVRTPTTEHGEEQAER